MLGIFSNKESRSTTENPCTTEEAYTTENKYATEEAYTTENKYATEEVYTSENKYATEEAYIKYATEDSKNKYITEEAYIAKNKNAAEEAYTTENKYATEEVQVTENKYAPEKAYITENKYATEEAYTTENKYATEEAYTTRNKYATKEGEQEDLATVLIGGCSDDIKDPELHLPMAYHPQTLTCGIPNSPFTSCVRQAGAFINNSVVLCGPEDESGTNCYEYCLDSWKLDFYGWNSFPSLQKMNQAPIAMNTAWTPGNW